ncbi:MAG TPA: adenosylhomocysteinase, partial [Candidatus Micrarchaeota archaeon]|nr:adenosylhomocysteinase [Candidatus Micrarchaeota archaeon]
VSVVPKIIDDEVARIALESAGIHLKPPTKEQVEYANAWDEGT